jgi:hypothetical protein
MSATICSRCVLPDTFPGVKIQDGLCNHCRKAGSADEIRSRKKGLWPQIDEAVEAARGQGEYDCIVALSGGKDSCYTLKLLVDRYKLRCLAVAVDNGFWSDKAAANCKTVTTALGVDLVVFTPAFSFMRQMYAESLVSAPSQVKAAAKRASSICNSCIDLINTFMAKTALRHGAGLVAAGYVSGQVPTDTAVIRIDTSRQAVQRAPMLARLAGRMGEPARHYFQVSPGGPHAVITLINPMLAQSLRDEEIIAELLPLGWAKSSDAGAHSTNCQLNDIGILAHIQLHHFHPYVFEISEQVRAGLTSRAEAMQRTSALPSADQRDALLNRLGLAPDHCGLFPPGSEARR